MLNTGEPGRAELARQYLERARKAADSLNDLIETWDSPLDSQTLYKVASANALVAIALAQVPSEPRDRPA